MTALTFQPIEARPAPNKTEGLLAWIKINLFGGPITGLLTVLIGGALLYLIPQFLSWAIFRAAWAPNYDACRVDGVVHAGAWSPRNTALSCLVATRLRSSGAH